MASFQNALAAACGACSPDEVSLKVRSDVVEAVWSAPEVPECVMNWLLETGRKARQRVDRRERRSAAKESFFIEEQDSPGVKPLFGQRSPDPAAAVVAKDLASAIVHDKFDEEIVAACLGEHPLFEDFGEFATGQKNYSTAHAYKRRERLRQRLGSLLSK